MTPEQRSAMARGLGTFRAGLVWHLGLALLSYTALIAGYVLHLTLWVQVVSVARGVAVVATAGVMLLGLGRCAAAERRGTTVAALTLLGLATAADLWHLGVVLDSVSLPPFSSHAGMVRASQLTGAAHAAALLALLLLLGSCAGLARDVGASPLGRTASRLRLPLGLVLLLALAFRLPLVTGILVPGWLLVGLAAVGLALAAALLLLVLRLLRRLQVKLASRSDGAHDEA